MKRFLLAILVIAGCSRRTEIPLTNTSAPATPQTSTVSAKSVAPPVSPSTITRSSTGALDACSLISVHDLERITGSTFKAGVNTTTQTAVMRCTFPRESGGGITIVLHLKDAMPEYRAMAGMIPVAGIPDEALWSSQVTTFADRKGSQVLVVGFNFSGGDQKQWGEEIVRAILPKL